MRITKHGLSQLLTEPVDVLLAHASMLPEGRTLETTDGLFKARKSAVMLLFYETANDIILFFTRRSRLLKYHPGQISFPGGRCEPYELDDPLLTALRETHEEIGISPVEVEVLGKLSELYVSVSHFLIHPYVGWLQHEPNCTINHFEVDELINISISELFDPAKKGYHLAETSSGALNVPCYLIGGHVIWGATAMMLAELEAKLKRYCSHRGAR
jgi:8-oxo-dGTP pyrophosphatase MutT (NUDIX family)